MQTINLNAIIDKIALAIANDTDLDTWCNENYDKSITVFIGWDGKSPPTSRIALIA